MNLSQNRKNEVKDVVTSKLNIDQQKIAPIEALNLVFGEYAPNTQRAYARAFKNLQDWADIKDIGEMENFGPLRILEFKKHLIFPDLLVSTFSKKLVFGTFSHRKVTFPTFPNSCGNFFVRKDSKKPQNDEKVIF